MADMNLFIIISIDYETIRGICEWQVMALLFVVGRFVQVQIYLPLAIFQSRTVDGCGSVGRLGSNGGLGG